MDLRMQFECVRLCGANKWTQASTLQQQFNTTNPQSDLALANGQLSLDFFLLLFLKIFL